jgi:murein DD-endopeptidase / murein LD-carboxypeptidase
MLDLADIPTRFWSVPYDATRMPGGSSQADIGDGANCQLFAYALLCHFGVVVPPFRSSGLWEDRDYTTVETDNFAPLDLLLFSATGDAWGAHVGVSLGADRAIHLSQRVGLPAVWSLDRFRTEDDYRILIGAKRIRDKRG